MFQTNLQQFHDFIWLAIHVLWERSLIEQSSSYTFSVWFNWLQIFAINCDLSFIWLYWPQIFTINCDLSFVWFYWLQIFTINSDLSFIWLLLTSNLYSQLWFILCLIFIDLIRIQSILIHTMYDWFFWTSNVNNEFRLILCLVFVIIKSYHHLSHFWSFIQRSLLSPDCFVAVWYKYAQ